MFVQFLDASLNDHKIHTRLHLANDESTLHRTRQKGRTNEKLEKEKKSVENSIFTPKISLPR